jgi:hypothetical protein
MILNDKPNCQVLKYFDENPRLIHVKTLGEDLKVYIWLFFIAILKFHQKFIKYINLATPPHPLQNDHNFSYGN